MARRGLMGGVKGVVSLSLGVATLVVGILKFFEKETRCCLALDPCDACPIVAWLPAALRAKEIVAINECPDAFALALRYQDATGNWRETGWQRIAPDTNGYLVDGSQQRIMSYGASYSYAWQNIGSDDRIVVNSSPSKSSMRNQNVYNELGAWIAHTTRIKFRCEQ